MDIKELTERMHRFVRSKGWYESDSRRPQTPRNLAISLSLEANEVLEHFQWQAELKDMDELPVSWLMWAYTYCNWLPFPGSTLNRQF